MFHLNENPQIDQFLVNMNNQYDFKIAKYQDALQFRKSKSVKYYNGKKYPLSCSIKQFKKYGPGIYLYFALLRSLILILIISAIISIPSLVSNYNGQGLEIFGQGNFNTKIMKYSLANQHYYQWNQVMKNQGLLKNMQINKKIIIFGDLLISITFLLFIIYWRIQSVRLVNQCISQTALPSYYTILLKSIPQNCNEEMIKAHFSKFGKVAQISSIKNLSSIQNSITQFCELINKLKIQRKLIELDSNRNKIKYINLYNKLLSKYIDLKQQYRKIERNKSVYAFVSFDHINARNYVIDLYKFKINPQQLLLQGKQIQIQKCHIQPPNILWENFHIKDSIHFKKSIFQFVILFIVLFISLLALFLIQINKNTQFQVESNLHYTFAQVIELNQQKITDSFCYGLSYRSFKEQYYPLCKGYLTRYKQHLILTIAYSCVIVAINYILNLIIGALVDFRKYSTNTQKNRFLITNMFLFYFINTAILTLLVQIQIGDLSIKKIISSILHIQSKYLKVSLYNQFTRKWFINVGSQIIINYIISLIVCPLIPLFSQKFFRILRQIRAQKKKIQKQMNQTILDPEMDFNWYYSQILNIIFFTFSFSSGIPIFYSLAIISLVIIYLSSKFIFIRYSRQPKIFDHSLNSVISRILPTSLILHQIMCIFFYNVQQIFPNCYERQLDLGNSLLRKMKEGYYFLIIIMIILLYIIFQNKIVKCTQKLLKKNQQLFINEKPFEQMYFNKKFIYSYKIQDNPKYQNILYTLMILETLQKKRRNQIENIKTQSNIQNIIQVQNQQKWKSCKILQKTTVQSDRDIQNLLTIQIDSETQRNLTK